MRELGKAASASAMSRGPPKAFSFATEAGVAQSIARNNPCRDLKALAGSKHDLRIDPIAMLLRGRKMSFEKIIKMIDGIVVLLEEHRTDDGDELMRNWTRLKTRSLNMPSMILPSPSRKTRDPWRLRPKKFPGVLSRSASM